MYKLPSASRGRTSERVFFLSKDQRSRLELACYEHELKPLVASPDLQAVRCSRAVEL